jgi:DNA-binding transcriptional regulator YhcF (GntR family)
MRLRVDAHNPIPVRQPLSEPFEHAIQGGGVSRDQARPSIREVVGCLGSNPNAVERTMEDLKRSGYRPLRPCPEAP